MFNWQKANNKHTSKWFL